MEPPPPATTPTASDSIDSSPRAPRAALPETSDDTAAATAPRLRLMCSYGGHIVPRPHDKSLCYVGGETRIVVADRSSCLSALNGRLSRTLLGGAGFALKYQLPNEDLDSLISVTTDEDLDNMIDEYDRSRPNRLRLFLFAKSDSSSKSNDDGGGGGGDDWFVAALNGGGGNNGSGRGFSDSASVNCLLGLDDDVLIHSSAVTTTTTAVVVEPVAMAAVGKKVQDVQAVSVPDSPMLDTTSSFGSTSSSSKAAAGLIEDQFAQILVMSSPSIAAAINPTMVGGIGISDDERSDLNNNGVGGGGGVPIGYRKQQLYHQTSLPQKPNIDLPSPDSVSSDTSFGTAIQRSKALVYDQNQMIQNQKPLLVDTTKQLNTTNTNTNTNEYVLQQQYVQHQPYIHHHNPGNTVPTYYHPVYTSQPPPQYPVYYLPARQPYNNLSQSSSLNDASANATAAYRTMVPTPTQAPAPLVHMTSSGHQQYVGTGGGVGGYSQIHNPGLSQYEYVGEQGRPQQIYYTQPLGPIGASPYQTMTEDGIKQQQQMRTSQPL